MVFVCWFQPKTLPFRRSEVTFQNWPPLAFIFRKSWNKESKGLFQVGFNPQSVAFFWGGWYFYIFCLQENCFQKFELNHCFFSRICLGELQLRSYWGANGLRHLHACLRCPFFLSFLHVLPRSCCYPLSDLQCSALSQIFSWQFNTRPLPKYFCRLMQSRME